MRATPSALLDNPQLTDRGDAKELLELSGARVPAFNLVAALLATPLVAVVITASVGGVHLAAMVLIMAPGLLLGLSEAWIETIATAVTVVVFLGGAARVLLTRGDVVPLPDNRELLYALLLHLHPLRADAPSAIRRGRAVAHLIDVTAPTHSGQEVTAHVASCYDGDDLLLSLAVDHRHLTADRLRAAVNAHPTLLARLQRAGLTPDDLTLTIHTGEDRSWLVLEDVAIADHHLAAIAPVPSIDRPDLDSRELIPLDIDPDQHDPPVTAALLAQTALLAAGARPPQPAAASTWRLAPASDLPDPPDPHERRSWLLSPPLLAPTAPVLVPNRHNGETLLGVAAFWLITLSIGAALILAYVTYGATPSRATATLAALGWLAASAGGFVLGEPQLARRADLAPRRVRLPPAELTLDQGRLQLGGDVIDLGQPFRVHLTRGARAQGGQQPITIQLTQRTSRIAVRIEGVEASSVTSLDALDSDAPLCPPDSARELWGRLRAWAALHGEPPRWRLEPVDQNTMS